MHDINGKVLHVGDQITTYGMGLAKITRIIDEDNVEKQGACVEVDGKEGKREIRLHVAGAVKVRTWKELATEALAVQDACNLSGVVISFGHVIREVRAMLEAENKGGTDAVNTHPVCVLYADKVAHLTGTQGFGNDGVGAAYTWAHDLTKKAG